MTREEFEYAIKSCGCFIYRGHIYYEESELIKAFEDMGLIKQELCEDAISQQGDDRWLLHFGQNMAIPSAEPYKDMTNGEVMQKIFKGVIHHIDGQPYIDYCYENQVNAFTVDWWNSPYKPQERSEQND